MFKFSLNLTHTERKLFDTLYRLDLFLEDGKLTIAINRWNPYKERVEFCKKFDFTYTNLEKMHPSVKQKLAMDGKVWLKDEGLDKYAKMFNWGYFRHYEGCESCNSFGFVPLMNFYTGCSVCNKNDRGRYTHFEASEKSKRMLR